MRRAWLVAALAALGGAASATPAGAASATFDTGFVDQAVMSGPDRDAWIDRARSVGATRVRVAFSWASVAPTAPPADAAGSAAWGGYRFDNVDAQVRSAVGKGLVPMLSTTGAPSWATGPGKPKSANASAWKPDVAAFGAFMHALAERYSGSFPDPLNPGAALPRVTQFQVWNEPNLNLYLAPQNEGGVPFASQRFRELVNAGTANVKAVQPGATVVAGGLAPFGDPGSNPARTRPVAFLRQMLCLDDRLQRTCDQKTSVDVFSLHPYAVDRPGRSAYDPDDATIPNANRIQTVLAAAATVGTTGPRLPPLWVTEFQYESKGPDPDGIPLATRARYISETFWRLWRAGVPVAFWYLLRDEAPTPSYNRTYQSGIFYRDGRRKSDARAFRFPLMVTGKSASRLNVWLRTPTAGTVTVQVRRGGEWRSATKVRGLPLNGVARVKVPRTGVTAVRGIAGKATSFAWDVG